MEQDEAKLMYKHKLNDIKKHYNIEFDIEHGKDNNIKNITFVNLIYKSGLSDISIGYDATANKLNFIKYNILDSRVVKSLNHKKIIPTLEKQYKLKFVIAEINRINNEYIKKLNDINNKYQ